MAGPKKMFSSFFIINRIHIHININVVIIFFFWRCRSRISFYSRCICYRVCLFFCPFFAVVFCCVGRSALPKMDFFLFRRLIRFLSGNMELENFGDFAMKRFSSFCPFSVLTQTKKLFFFAPFFFRVAASSRDPHLHIKKAVRVPSFSFTEFSFSRLYFSSRFLVPCSPSLFFFVFGSFYRVFTSRFSFYDWMIFFCLVFFWQ